MPLLEFKDIPYTLNHRSPPSTLPLYTSKQFSLADHFAGDHKSSYDVFTPKCIEDNGERLLLYLLKLLIPQHSTTVNCLHKQNINKQINRRMLLQKPK